MRPLVNIAPLGRRWEVAALRRRDPRDRWVSIRSAAVSGTIGLLFWIAVLAGGAAVGFVFAACVRLVIA